VIGWSGYLPTSQEVELLVTSCPFGQEIDRAGSGRDYVNTGKHIDEQMHTFNIKA
jgi:hypothetical protein